MEKQLLKGGRERDQTINEKPTHGNFRMHEDCPGKGGWRGWSFRFHLWSWGWGRKFYCNYRSHLPLWEIEMWKLAPVETENTNLNEHILCQETLNRIQMASPARLAAPVKMKKKFSQFTRNIQLPAGLLGCIYIYILNFSKFFKLKLKINFKTLSGNWDLICI